MKIAMYAKQAVKYGIFTSVFFAALGTFQLGRDVRAMILSGNPLNRG